MPLRRAPRLDPSAIRSSFAQAPTAEGLNHVYENGAGVGQPGPVPVARDGWLGALIVATDWNNFAPRVGIAYSPNSRPRSSARLANSPLPGACAVNAWRPIPTLAVSRETAEHSTSSWSTISARCRHEGLRTIQSPATVADECCCGRRAASQARSAACCGRHAERVGRSAGTLWGPVAV